MSVPFPAASDQAAPGPCRSSWRQRAKAAACCMRAGTRPKSR